MTDSAQPADLTPLTTTLDGLLSYNTIHTPDAVALIDTPSIDRLRRLSFRETERAIGRVAEKLRLLGLPPGSVIAVQAANVSETVVALLAILRAGFVAAPIPLLWRHGEARALAGVQARALIAVSDYAEESLRIAAATFSIRYVAAFGHHVADGMVPLGDLLDEAPDEVMPRALPHDPRREAVITFEAGADGHLPCRRTHAGLIVGGAAVMLEADVQRHAGLLSTVLPSSYGALCVGLVPWLLAGGTLALHQPFDAEIFARLKDETPADLIALPGPLLPSLLQAGAIGEGPSILALWRSPERHRTSAPWAGEAILIDVLTFGEAGFVPLRRRADGAPGDLAIGDVTAPRDAPGAMVVATLSRTTAGTLALGGPMSPLPPLGERNGAAVDTGFPCRLDPVTGFVALSGPPAGTVSVGGYRFALQELHDMVGRVTPQALLAALPDLLVGHKLAGSGADLEAIRGALADEGASPLVNAAFRDRRIG